MGQMKAYGQWAFEQGYLDANYVPVDPNKNDMDFVDEYLKEDIKEVRVKNMASSHFNNATTAQLEVVVKTIHKKEKQ